MNLKDLKLGQLGQLGQLNPVILQTLGLLLLALMVGGLWYRLAYTPLTAQQEALKAQFADLTAQLAVAHDKEAQIPVLTAKALDQAAEWQAFRLRLPPDERSARLIGDIDRLALLHGVKLDTIGRTTSALTPAGLEKTSLSLQIAGRFDQVYDFLDDATSMNRYTSLASLQFAVGSDPHPVSATLSLSAFTYSQTPTPPAPTPQEESHAAAPASHPSPAPNQP